MPTIIERIIPNVKIKLITKPVNTTKITPNNNNKIELSKIGVASIFFLISK